MSRSWVLVVSLVGLLLGPLLVSPAGAAGPVPPVNQVPPSVTGTARVGELLTAAPGTWLPAPDGYSYQWLRDGAPVPGAGARTYRLVAADHQHRISVRVSADGGLAYSEPTSAIGLGVFAATGPPAITGVRRWGRELSVKPGTWAPTATSYRYQWLRGGRAISGATDKTYTLRVADVGQRISVRVTARRAVYADGVATSARTGAIGNRVPVRKRYTYSIVTRGRITADVEQFAALAAASYADPRGWRSAGYRFTRVARGGDFTLVLASASRVPGFGSPCSSTWSCRVGRYVIINQTRWQHASPSWNAAGHSLRDYRHMVINHETGHWLGHRHRSCSGKGKRAPVMMQQSKGLGGCRFNPFPLPSERWTRR